LFVVRKRVPTTLPTYELSDEMGKPIKNKFYAQELQSVSPPESYRIKKIIRSERGNDEKSKRWSLCLSLPQIERRPSKVLHTGWSVVGIIDPS